ncbi:hypothetical protein BC830DRAFT_1120508 [Chytriomyces sp. MP71]|nr:hypothetical protein BC830DRAFT_1120508 [Chytriomyces sp. MP71]
MFQEPQQQPQVVSPLASTPSITSIRGTIPLPSRSNRSSWYIDRQSSGLDDEDAFESFAGDVGSLLDGEAPPLHFGDLEDVVAPVGETAFGAISFTIPVSLGRTPSLPSFQNRSGDSEGCGGVSVRGETEFVDENDEEIASLVAEIRRLEALQRRQPQLHHEQPEGRQLSSDSSVRSSMGGLPGDGVTLDLEFAKVTSPDGESGGKQYELDGIPVSADEAVELEVPHAVSDDHIPLDETIAVIASTDVSFKDEQEYLTLHSAIASVDDEAAMEVPAEANHPAINFLNTANPDQSSDSSEEPVELSLSTMSPACTKMREQSEKFSTSTMIETFELEIGHHDTAAMPGCASIEGGVPLEAEPAEDKSINLKMASTDPASSSFLQTVAYSDSDGNPETILHANRSLNGTNTVEVMEVEDGEVRTAVDESDPIESFTHLSDGMETLESVDGWEGTVAESDIGGTGDFDLKEGFVTEEKDTADYNPVEATEASLDYKGPHFTDSQQHQVVNGANFEAFAAEEVEFTLEGLGGETSVEIEAAPQKPRELNDLRTDSGADLDESALVDVSVVTSEAVVSAAKACRFSNILLFRDAP